MIGLDATLIFDVESLGVTKVDADIDRRWCLRATHIDVALWERDLYAVSLKALVDILV